MTDPHFGPTGHRFADGAGMRTGSIWLFVLRGSPDNAVDAANQAAHGTLVGVVGSIIVLIVGSGS